MQLILTGIMSDKICIWDNESGYEDLFTEDDYKLLKCFVGVANEEVITNFARDNIIGIKPNRYAPDGTLLYSYAKHGSKVYLNAKKLGAFCLHGSGVFVLPECLESVHDAAFMSCDLLGEVDIINAPVHLLSRLHRLLGEASVAYTESADNSALYGIESELVAMRLVDFTDYEDSTLVKWNLESIEKMGQSHHEWHLDYNLGVWSPENDRLVYFLRYVVPSELKVPEAYSFAVGYFLSNGRDKRVIQYLYDYVFS